ncbi:MAG TPA: Gfo/Idh/MocA family oxidoreductase [Longimicrobiales bacterium]|nr:Gfo/Idh/MocA family oxidoreductase [Longimicrobiales bacterium]
MHNVNVGILGCGYWGPKLARNFARHPHASLVAVADVIGDRAERIGAEFRTPLVTQDPDRVLLNPAVDLVVVATPVWTHYDLASRAIRAGKHVLVMKPLATRTDRAEELCAMARAQGVLLAVDHTFIFTGAIQKMKELVDADELGELYYFDSVRINLGLFQHDVNVLWDLAPHDVSIMDHLIGELPDEVTAVGMCHGGSPTENIAYLTVRYGSSFLGHVHVNWLAPAKIRRTIVGGSRKMLVYDDMEPSEKIRVYDKGVSFLSDTTDPAEAQYKPLVSYRSGDMWVPQIEMQEALAVEVDNVIAAINGRESLMVDGHDGTRVVRILEAAEQSIRSSGAPVALQKPAPKLKAVSGMS